MASTPPPVVPEGSDGRIDGPLGLRNPPRAPAGSRSPRGTRAASAGQVVEGSEGQEASGSTRPRRLVANDWTPRRKGTGRLDTPSSVWQTIPPAGRRLSATRRERQPGPRSSRGVPERAQGRGGSGGLPTPSRASSAARTATQTDPQGALPDLGRPPRTVGGAAPPPPIAGEG